MYTSRNTLYKKTSVALAISAVLSASSLTVASDNTELPTVTVTSDFRDTKLQELPISATVVTDRDIQERAAQHLQDVLNKAPNVNFTSGASRGRYVQIRGIGERSQFVDPINPSVGMTIDDIDFSGIGNAGTLFDVAQVEVLRGPQGTRFGANALAGMVKIKSQDPTEEFEGLLQAKYGNYNTWSLGAMVSGGISDRLLGRLAIQQFSSDGYIENDFLGKDDTNNLDEQTVRGKLRFLASDDLTIDTTLLYVDVDNGYDAFSLDNNRHTLSDEPGRDTQETAAASVKAKWTGSDAADLEVTASYANTNLEYGYDEDWTFVGIAPGWEYSTTDNYIRDRDSVSVDARLVSKDAGKVFTGTSWVLGIYADQRDVDLTRDFFDWDLFAQTRFLSDYQADNTAIYSQLETPLSDKLTLSYGARLERFSADYQDNNAIADSLDENLWGGQVSLEYLATGNTMVYATLSRGYKAGGINGEALRKAEVSGYSDADKAFLRERVEFDTETLINGEVGLKGSYLEDSLQIHASLFYMKRKDVQLKGWLNQGASFAGYTDNAAKGNNYGLELEANWQVNTMLQLFANIGWLETEIDGYSAVDVDTGLLVDKSGRDQAQAPSYQFNLGGQVNFAEHFYARLEVEGKDEFYLSDSHNQQSDAYELLNMTIGYQVDQLEVLLWGRNLTDEDYVVRGFYFGNDPRIEYPNKAYNQLGEPRVVGVTTRWSF